MLMFFFGPGSLTYHTSDGVGGNLFELRLKSDENLNPYKRNIRWRGRDLDTTFKLKDLGGSGSF